MSSTLLPSNATKLERALCDVTERVTALPVEILRTLWNPWDCPVDMLPWLAWSLSVDSWDSAWTEQQKRATIAASIEVHRHKGTIGALRRALDALGYSITIIENADGPYTFRVSINVSTTTLSVEDAYAEVKRVALQNKNARSSLTSVGANSEARATLSIMTAVAYVQTIEILPPPHPPYYWSDGTGLNWSDGSAILT